MGSDELAERFAASRIEPVGDRRIDFNFALLRRTVISIVTSKNLPTIAQLLPDWWAKPETPEEEEARTVQRLDALFGADGWGGTDGR